MQDLSEASNRGVLYVPGSSVPTSPEPADAPSHGPAASWSEVPWRTILATVGVIVATYALIIVVLAEERIVVWVILAGFMAVVLAPLVTQVDRRLGGRRALSAGVVMIATLLIIVGTVALFVMPVRTQLVNIITDLPGTVHDAANGKGPVGHIVQRLHIEKYVKDNEGKLSRAAARLSGSSFEAARQVFSAVFAFVTITLITFFFLCQSAAMGRAALNLLPHRRRGPAQRIASDAASAVSGYVIGNLIISVIAGVAAFCCLLILGVPSPVVLALFVAFCDLIPLVGATLGAAVCVIAAYLHSPTAGLISVIFFVVYQQIENGLIYPWIMARKVNVSPLAILLSVLLAVELFGIVGALLAVPFSGALQVVFTSIRQERRREQLVLPDNFGQSVDLTSPRDDASAS